MYSLAVIGDPIEHSLSPIIHQAFAKQIGIAIQYQKILSTRETCAQVIDLFKAQGGWGLNITAPCKRLAFDLCEHNNQASTLAEAVNTISFQQDGVLGDNTDGIGFIRDLMDNLQYCPSKKKILIIGAGGAVSGILHALLQTQPQCIHIVNRTKHKADALVKKFSNGGTLHAYRYDDPLDAYYDVMIHATSLRHTYPSIVDTLTLHKTTLCYDLMYQTDAPTAFMQWALQQGATQVYDGLGMLVEQAAQSFQVWFGEQPKTKLVIEHLKRGREK